MNNKRCPPHPNTQEIPKVLGALSQELGTKTKCLFLITYVGEEKLSSTFQGSSGWTNSQINIRLISRKTH